jgi:transposase-like protein
LVSLTTNYNLTKEIESLKSYQQERLLKIIQDLSIVNHINTDDLAFSEMICRKCETKHFVKNGHSPGGHQRYKCKKCGSSQSADANTPLYNP